jgi:hypothetical protein
VTGREVRQTTSTCGSAAPEPTRYAAAQGKVSSRLESEKRRLGEAEHIGRIDVDIVIIIATGQEQDITGAVSGRGEMRPAPGVPVGDNWVQVCDESW